MTDADLRQLYARMVARRAPATRERCVAPELLQAIVDDGASEAERLQALRHVAECDACRADLDLLRSTAEAARRLKRRSVPVLAVAASLAVLVGAAAVWRGGLLPLGARPEPLRGAGGGVALLGPIGDVPAESVRLVWHAVPRAARYDVEVLDGGGRVVFAASTRDTTAPLPRRAGLVPGADFHWWVQARLADGSESRSRAQPFHIRQR